LFHGSAITVNGKLIIFVVSGEYLLVFKVTITMISSFRVVFKQVIKSPFVFQEGIVIYLYPDAANTSIIISKGFHYTVVTSILNFI
jgi:hypothetical protein